MEERQVSVIITTYDRQEALAKTLRALGDQTLSPEAYEILVVDNGCSDGTTAFLNDLRMRCGFKVFHEERNIGISAARNVALRSARGKCVVMVSDDLIVPREFLQQHIVTLKRFTGFWVVGGFQQLPSLTDTPFGRYLDGLERRFEDGRKTNRLAEDIWEMSYPTARNLSLPREDLERIGLFDEQFHNSCEDQDLAERAKREGIRFLYNAGITCLHNDQAGELKRYCEAQRRGARDTVLFCAKYPTIHGEAEIAKVNGYLSVHQALGLTLKKLLKSLVAWKPITGLIERCVKVAEGLRPPEALLHRCYRLLIGVYIFRGWREGLKLLSKRSGIQNAQGIGCHSDI